MPSATSPSLSDLRRSLAEAALRAGPVAAGRIGLGVPEIDAVLSGGLQRAALHEIHAAGTADLAAATGFALGLALRAADGTGEAAERPILWARQDFVDAETGRLHAAGLNELGLDPARLLLVRARDAEGVLRAGAEGARCASLGAVLIEPWGEAKPFDLTASRRLSLAAEGAGVAVLLLRVAAREAPSAARTRWRVASLASRALAANAPGAPAFKLSLLRQKGGAAEREWRVEWDRDRHCFAERTAFDRLAPRRTMPRRYLALWFPFLATDRLRRKGRIPAFGAQADKPHVLVAIERNAMRIVDCDLNAVRLGLTRGLTLADARARIPDLVALESEPFADQDFLEDLAAFCDRFTPLVALDEPHGLMLDITGCAHLFGGEAGLGNWAARAMQRGGLQLKAAIAGTPDAARACARHGRGGIVPSGEEEAWLRPLPVAALDTDAETVIALSRAGLKTLAHLAARPSQTLSARFGEDLAIKLRRTLGREDRRITPLRPPPDCVVERHFAEPFADTASLEDVVARLIAEAGRVLEARGEGGRVFEIGFFRSDGAVRRLILETGRPSRDAKALLRLYRERIEALSDPLDPGFGFDAVKLAVPICEPMTTPQHSLDGRAVEEEAVADLVDRLVTRFGRDRVLRFAEQDSHHPVRSARALSAAAPLQERSWSAPEPEEPPARPLQLFEPPHPVEALAEVPDGPPIRFRWRRLTHDVARAEGPERIAPEWWRDGSDEPMRDYYRVEDAQGHRFWLYRTGFYEAEQAPPRWYLHGLFA